MTHSSKSWTLQHGLPQTCSLPRLQERYQARCLGRSNQVDVDGNWFGGHQRRRISHLVRYRVISSIISNWTLRLRKYPWVVGAVDIQPGLPIDARAIIALKSLWVQTLHGVRLFPMPVLLLTKYVRFGRKLSTMLKFLIAFAAAMVSSDYLVAKIWILIIPGDDESMPTVQCSRWSEWHHRLCVRYSSEITHDFTCWRCKVSVDLDKGVITHCYPRDQR